MRTTATTPLIADAAAETTRPGPRLSTSAGRMMRLTAETTMNPAAMKIMAPSTVEEKYSALERPKEYFASAGLAACLSATTATTAATRLTTDSAASESSPTDPVTK